MLKYGQLKLKKNSPILGDGSRWVGYQFKMTLILKKTTKKSTYSPYTPYYYMLQKSTKKTLWPRFMDGVQLPQG